MRLLSLFLLLLVFLSCEKSQPVVDASITVRYLEDRRQFTVRSNAPVGPPITFLGSALPVKAQNDSLMEFGERRQLPYPSQIEFGIPTADGSYHPISYRMPAPDPTTIPATIDTTQALTFTPLDQPLDETQFLEIFLEPEFRAPPKRFLIKGPTESGKITVPRISLRGLKTGKYRAYLILQQLDLIGFDGGFARVQSEYLTASQRVMVGG